MAGKSSTNRHIALLRGINVGRAKRIAMADLRELLAGLGYDDVRTLLNSGNAVFEARRGSATKMARAIEAAIADQLGLEVPVIVLNAAELDAVVREDPLGKRVTDPSRYLVAFLPGKRELAAAEPLRAEKWAPEALALGERAAYMWIPPGVAESKLAKAFERATRGAATARNWSTVLKLQAMAGGGSSAG